mmetsp:Transcript_64620/g.204293  ORF Transcript_64620/g.204293 Transcript_64620/m.204293 type:complete len:268 (-) Transcript_64620:299-1102(-)
MARHEPLKAIVDMLLVARHVEAQLEVCVIAGRGLVPGDWSAHHAGARAELLHGLLNFSTHRRFRNVQAVGRHDHVHGAIGMQSLAAPISGTPRGVHVLVHDPVVVHALCVCVGEELRSRVGREPCTAGRSQKSLEVAGYEAQALEGLLEEVGEVRKQRALAELGHVEACILDLLARGACGVPRHPLAHHREVLEDLSADVFLVHGELRLAVVQLRQTRLRTTRLRADLLELSACLVKACLGLCVLPPRGLIVRRVAGGHVIEVLREC